MLGASGSPARSPTHDAGAAELREADLELLMRAAELLHAHGTAANALESTLSACARRLGVQAQFFSTPTSFLAAFGEGRAQRTHLLRVQPGELELEKLALFDAVLADVEAGRSSSEAALVRLDAIAQSPPRFGRAATSLAFGIASAGAAIFFGGGARELVLSFVLGLVCGLVSLATGRRARSTRLFEPTASFLVAFLAVIAAHALHPLADRIVTLAGLIVLLPGLSITIAMNELATRHLASGSARLMGAIALLLTVAFGTALGRRLAEVAVGPALEGPVAHVLPDWTIWPVVVVSTFAFLVLFRARPRDYGWILATGILGYFSARHASAVLQVELGAFVGALVVGLTSNLLARVLRRPAVVTMLPGILLLVPGSIGYQSLSFFIARDVLSGMEAAFRTTLTATALVGGLLFASVLVPPRRTL